MIKIICFHNPDEENGYLSNWYHSKFMVGCYMYDSAEQYMMYRKAMVFNDTEIANKIMNTTDVSKIKALGREVRNFDDKAWDSVKENIMFTGLLEKFRQNSELGMRLKATGNSILAECAVKDRIWAIGLSMNDPRRFDPKQWRGQNLLGRILMRVRDAL